MVTCLSVFYFEGNSFKASLPSDIISLFMAIRAVPNIDVVASNFVFVDSNVPFTTEPAHSSISPFITEDICSKILEHTTTIALIAGLEEGEYVVVLQ